MGRMSPPDLSRRQFVAAAVAAAGAASLGGCGVLTVAARRPAASRDDPLRDWVVVGAAPLLSPDRGAEQFRTRAGAFRSAGVDIVMVPVANEPAGSDLMLRNLLQLHQYAAASGGGVQVIAEPDSLGRLLDEGGLGILPRLGGMGMIPGATAEAMLASVGGLRALGVQVIQPIHNWKNRIGDGCFERTDQRLTVTGRLAVRAINDAGLVIDLSGMGLQSSLEVLDLSNRPVVFSHSNAARVHAHPGNLTDEQIDRCARAGGVIGITAFPVLVSGSSAPTLGDLLRHVDYIAERAGIDYVGLGLDVDDRARRRFHSDPLPDPPYPYPESLTRPGYVRELRAALLSRGYSPAEAGQVLGGNYLRVLGRVWDQARGDT